MTDEPENLVLVQLREIRAELGHINGKLVEHDKQFAALNKHLEWVAEAAYMGVGLAQMANHKLDRLSDRFDTMDQRLQVVERRGAE